MALDVEPAGAEVAWGTAPAPPRISVHGWAGQLPNLDMYWIAKHSWDLQAAPPMALVGGQPDWSPGAARLAAWLGALMGGGSGHAAAAARYSEQLLHVAAFAAQQAGGAAAGPHAPFLAAGADAVTLALTAGAAGSAAGNQTLAACLAFVEGLARTLGNLEERLHHATPLYLLAGPSRAVGLGAYLALPGVLLAAALLQARGWLGAAWCCCMLLRHSAAADAALIGLQLQALHRGEVQKRALAVACPCKPWGA